MALHFGFEKINGGDFAEVVYDPALDAEGNQEKLEDGEPAWNLKGVTDSLIWSTMWLGLPEITKKNYKKFYERLRIYNDLFGPHRYFSRVPNVTALWIDRGDYWQYLVASKTVYGTVNFARKYYAEEEGGQDDPEYWKNMAEDAQQVFDEWPHGEFFIDVEGEDGELRFKILGSELLGDRIEEDAITLEVVKNHIGLWTNASKKSDAEFRKDVFERLQADTQRKITAEEEAANEDG